MKIILTETQVKILARLLNETTGELDKEYVRTGLFDENDKQIILSITNGDNFTKLIADMYKFLVNKYTSDHGVTPREIKPNEINYLKEVHQELKTYDKNVFPLHDLYAKDKFTHPLGIGNDLRLRRVLINRLRTFPSVYIRNLKNDIRRERNEYEFRALSDLLNSILQYLKLVDSVSEDKREIILAKVFSSENDTFEKVKDRLEKITIPYLSEDSLIEDIIEKIADMGDEAELLFNNNEILIVLIKSGEAMSYIGCSSQWCFARNSSGYWDQYAPEGYATIIFNFEEDPSEPTRMVVVLEDGSVYNMYNEYMEDGDQYLNSIGADQYINRYEMAEGVGDKYAEKHHGIEPEFNQFDKKYRAMKSDENHDKVVYHKKQKYNNKEITIIKNPRSVKSLGPDVRGVIDLNGNLYVEREPVLVHDTLIQILEYVGIIKYKKHWYEDISEYLTVHRFGTTNRFLVGNTHDDGLGEDDTERKQEYQTFLDKAHQVNPFINFVNEIRQA